MMKRPTPETDAETMRDEYDHVDSDIGPFAPSNTVCADFARKLERERDEALMDRARGETATMTINHYERILREREEWKNKAYSHATDYTLMEAKCFRLEQQLKEYDKLKS